MPNEDKALQYAKFILLSVGTFLLYKAFTKIGILPSKEEKEIEKAELTNGWLPNFWKDSLNAKKVTKADFTQKASVFYPALAKLINSSFGFWNDKESQIYASFKQIKTQASLSFLCSVYFTFYKVDLFNELKSRLSEDEFSTILKFTSKLPLYKAKL